MLGSFRLLERKREREGGLSKGPGAAPRDCGIGAESRERGWDNIWWGNGVRATLRGFVLILRAVGSFLRVFTRRTIQIKFGL